MSIVDRAQLSPKLASLFPAGVAAAVSDGPCTAEVLLPAEMQFLSAAASESRIQEFAGGRLCARLALAELGIVDFPVTMAADRRPLWPDGYVGSITHTNGHCAAVAAKSATVSAIGLDTERSGRVKPELWRRVCVPDEIAWLGGLDEQRRAQASTLIFSAKEAFYKCQYPSTLERLGFADVTIEVLDWDAAGGIFQVHPNRAFLFGEHLSSPMLGKFAVHDAFITAGIGVPARTQ